MSVFKPLVSTASITRSAQPLHRRHNPVATMLAQRVSPAAASSLGSTRVLRVSKCFHTDAVQLCFIYSRSSAVAAWQRLQQIGTRQETDSKQTTPDAIAPRSGRCSPCGSTHITPLPLKALITQLCTTTPLLPCAVGCCCSSSCANPPPAGGCCPPSAVWRPFWRQQEGGRRDCSAALHL